MLAYTLSCRENWSQSGPVARIAGDAIGADAHLPNMATAEFLSCLSKAAAEDVAVELNVPVQPTGKATRGAVIARVGEGRWLYPPALFAAGDAMTLPARPCEDSDALDEGSAEEALPEDEAVNDHTEEDAGNTADEADAQTPPSLPDNDGTPEANEPRAVPIRRRPRKDSGEVRAAA